MESEIYGPPEDKTNVWVRVYQRPDGQSQRGWVTYEKDSELESKVQELKDLEIEITMEEVFGGMVNVCFDTGEFDYEYKLWGSDKVADNLRELILSFDKEEFEKAKKAYEESEESEG